MATVLSKNTFVSVIDGWSINPENNVVPVNVLERLKKHKFFKAMVNLGKYIVESTKSDELPHENPANNAITQIVDEIHLMTITEAKKVIQGDGTEENHGLLDVHVLKELLKGDPRTGIQTLCNAQIKILYERPPKED